jgi:N-acetylglucosamine malate deacetylase 2
VSGGSTDLSGLFRTGADFHRNGSSVAIVIAHPDDEVIGAGAQLPRLSNPLVICVTDGSPRNLADALSAGFATREDYGKARQNEMYSALESVKIHRSRVHVLELVDQEASFHLIELTHRIQNLLLEFQPDAILTQPYEGGHPDHDATAFAVHAATETLRRSGGHTPTIVEMTSYHLRNGRMHTGSFLPGDGRDEIEFHLSEPERALKRCLFAHYGSQKNVLQYFPIDVERFRFAPDYNFTRPPHNGSLFYESFSWGVTGDSWRELVREAFHSLNLINAYDTCSA